MMLAISSSNPKRRKNWNNINKNRKKSNSSSNNLLIIRKVVMLLLAISSFLLLYYTSSRDVTTKLSLSSSAVAPGGGGGGGGIIEHLQSFRQQQQHGQKDTTSSSLAQQVPASSNSNVIDYIEDVIICGGCRHAIINDNERCGSIMLSYINEQNQQQQNGVEISTSSASSLLLKDAGRYAAQKYPNVCRRCSDDSNTGCSSSSSNNNEGKKRYWRYDRIVQIHNSANSRTLQLPSVPSRYRIPKSATIINHNNNITEYFTSKLLMSAVQQSQQQRTHNFGYLFDYNPSIIQLPDSYQQKTKLSNGVYLASFRVSNSNYCFKPSDRKLMNQYYVRMQMQASSNAAAENKQQQQPQKLPPKDMLGLAVLDKDLNIIQNAVFDLKASTKIFYQTEDFRLFNLNDQIYLASYDEITPIRFDGGENNANNNKKGAIHIPPTFGNDLKLYVRQNPSCVRCPRRMCGKNFNYFIDKTSKGARVELWPSPPHTIQSIDLDNHNSQKCNRRQNVPYEYVDNIDANNNAPPLVPSFATVEELYFPYLRGRNEVLLTRGRGGACCIEITINNYPAAVATTNSTRLLVGISHSKTPSQGRRRLPIGNYNITDNHYLSQIYAFEPYPPYRIVAQSGYFCLGFPPATAADEQKDAVPVARATRWRHLIIGPESFESCPRIHFVSGITIKADDPSKVLVAYGINDCVSRIVEISIDHIKDLLFVGATTKRRGSGQAS